MLKKSDFYYDLPEELIAQTPSEPRDASRMLVYDRGADEFFHRRFFELTDFLKKGDLLVVNKTKVLPARIYGIKEDTGAKVEFLLHKRLNLTDWEVLARPAKKVTPGTSFAVSPRLSLTATGYRDEGLRSVRFHYDGVFEDLLAEVGEMPVPPYIRTKPADGRRYQTVYAKVDGSSAAPTAGLHFTESLLDKIKAMGVEIAEVLLHVGLGTFRPVKEDNLLEHKMHSEYYQIDKASADLINSAVREGRRIIAVGTTSVRVLESVADEEGYVRECCGDTQIFIYPPYRFKTVKGLITNFHLPESTLVMLVSAFIGREKTLEMYKLAVEEKYRFFSFGDATLLL